MFVTAVLWRLAVRTRRVAEAKHGVRLFCAAEASLQSSAFELVEKEESAEEDSVSLSSVLLAQL